MELDKYSKKFIHYYSLQLPELVKAIIKSNPGLKVIADLGCGDGSLLYSLNKAKLLDCFDKIYAVDLSEERINRVRHISPRITCFISDTCNVPDIKSESVNIIIANQVIEHVKDDGALVEEIKRITRPEGLIYISTVFKKRYAWYFFKNRLNQWVIDPTHEREYLCDNQLLDKLKKLGLLIIKNQKTLHWFAITDFILKRIGFKQDVYETNAIFRTLRRIKVPILGYYNWEIVCRKV